MAWDPEQKWLPVKHARTHLSERYNSVALVVGPIHKLYYSVPVIVLSAIFLAEGDIDPASKTFTELGATRNLYSRLVFYVAALQIIGGLRRATWKDIPKLNQAASPVQMASLASLGLRHYMVASILGPAAFTFVWVETFHGHRIAEFVKVAEASGSYAAAVVGSCS